MTARNGETTEASNGTGFYNLCFELVGLQYSAGSICIFPFWFCGSGCEIYGGRCMECLVLMYSSDGNGL